MMIGNWFCWYHLFSGIGRKWDITTTIVTVHTAILWRCVAAALVYWFHLFSEWWEDVFLLLVIQCCSALDGTNTDTIITTTTISADQSRLCKFAIHVVCCFQLQKFTYTVMIYSILHVIESICINCKIFISRNFGWMHRKMGNQKWKWKTNQMIEGLLLYPKLTSDVIPTLPFLFWLLSMLFSQQLFTWCSMQTKHARHLGY